ncbi:hypothetical protein EAH89_04485 [Roseomonas nepalensis]|uniref:Uncharacterized protein n=1 Tax=Muricoccus nepalensis TaxID=1854500 RepID=A0A502GI31_9PROT|nr:hypothetical protein EAH89_04485 [Roseomonas nepalensis]
MPREGFAAALGSLLAEPERRAALAAAARRHRARPERRHPLDRAREAVAALAAPHAAPCPPRHQFVAEGAPSPGGADPLDAALEGLRAAFAAIDPAGPGGPLPRAAARWPSWPAASPPALPAEDRETLLREAEAILAAYAPRLPLDAPPMPWTGFLPDEPGLAGRDTASRFTLLVPAGAAWVQLRLATALPLDLRLSLLDLEGGALGGLRPHRLHPGQSLLELDRPEGSGGRPARLVVEASGGDPASGGPRVLQFACGTRAGPFPLLADLSRDAMDRFRAELPDSWWRAARQAAAHRPLSRSGRGAEGAHGARAEPHDALLRPAGAPLPSGLGLFGTLPKEDPQAEGCAASVDTPSPAVDAVLLRTRALLEAAPLHRLALGRRALGLDRPYLLAARLGGGLPPAGDLPSLAAGLGLDLVLAGGGRARRLSPDGEARDGAVALSGLVRAGEAGCRALWLPEEEADERALIALGWLAGVPVAAAASNPFARAALRPPADGLLLRRAGAGGLEALLREPALAEALARGGDRALAGWLG